MHSLLDGMQGVQGVEVSVVAQTVSVRHDPAAAPPAALLAALNGALLEASLAAPRAQARARGRWLPPWHVLAGVALLALSLLHWLSAPTGAAWLEQLQWLALGAVALCLPRCALRALLALRHLVIDIHLLVTLACECVSAWLGQGCGRQRLQPAPAGGARRRERATGSRMPHAAPAAACLPRRPALTPALAFDSPRRWLRRRGRHRAGRLWRGGRHCGAVCACRALGGRGHRQGPRRRRRGPAAAPRERCASDEGAPRVQLAGGGALVCSSSRLGLHGPLRDHGPCPHAVPRPLCPL